MTAIARLSASLSTTARTTRLAGANATAGVTFRIIRSPAPVGLVAATSRIPTRARPTFIVPPFAASNRRLGPGQVQVVDHMKYAGNHGGSLHETARRSHPCSAPCMARGRDTRRAGTACDAWRASVDELAGPVPRAGVAPDW